MKIWQTARFDRTFKKLHSSSQTRVNEAIRRLVTDPLLGERKSGDLGEFFVYKFREGKHLWLLAYRLGDGDSIQLIDLGSHENFYKGLRKLRGVSAKKRIISD